MNNFNYNLRSLITDMDDTTTEDCATCNHSGMINEDEVCWNCEGKGQTTRS